MTEQSLYERIGGVNAISMVVDRFSDEVVKNPKLNVNPALKEWNQSGKLPGLKFMRTLWLCQAAVPEREKQEVLAAIVANKPEVVNG